MPDPTAQLRPLFTWRSAIADSDLTPVVRHVLLTLSTYMNERGGSAYPGSARLAHDTGLHQTTVKRSLADAVKNGYLAIVQRGGSPVGGKRLATEYAACSPQHGAADRVWTDQGQTATGTSGSSDQGQTIQGPGVQGDPISSLSTSENSRSVSQAPIACVRCHGRGSFWNGMNQIICTDHTFNDEPAVPPPWVQAGQTYADWAELQHDNPSMEEVQA